MTMPRKYTGFLTQFSVFKKISYILLQHLRNELGAWDICLTNIYIIHSGSEAVSPESEDISLALAIQGLKTKITRNAFSQLD